MEKKKVPIDHKNAVIRVHGLKKAFGDYPVLRGIDQERENPYS
jgi:phospholipid/cholesterol/gamma-HCH transport system ATP-binding protein